MKEKKVIDVVKLTEEEINTLKQYQKAVENEKTHLGNLRLHFLLSEKNCINNIEKVQNEFYSHLKMLSQSKKIPTSGEWFFDPENYVFRKKT